MSMNYITFRSITPAQRGQSILQKASISCTLQRTPRWMQQRSCGYSLRLRPADTLEAVRLLRRSGVDFGRVYGGTEELPEELML